MKIEVISDVICPWCFLGKRRLDKALALVPEVKAEVIFRPFFLDSTIPPMGLDRHAYMVAKFGEARLKDLHNPLEEAARKDGVPYNFEKITRTPNTLSAHRLMRWAYEDDKQPEIVEALFCAYWRDGIDIGDVSELAAIATQCSMDGPKIAERLATQEDAQEVTEEVQRAYQLGVTGVPTFIFNSKHGISGAQEVDVLVDVLTRVANGQV